MFLPQPIPSAEPHRAPEPVDSPSPETLVYAGFWMRSVAALIDRVIVGVSLWIFVSIILVVAGVSFRTASGWLIFPLVLLYLAGGWLYCSLMESSGTQATLGKMALGLIVTDRRGEPLLFGQATGRYLARILSALTVGAGYFMAAFTERKQALHDLLAGSHVLLRVPHTRLFEP